MELTTPTRRRMIMGRMLKIAGIGMAALATVLMIAPDAGARIKYRDLEDKKNDYTQRGIQLYAGLGNQRYDIEESFDQSLEDVDDDNGLFFIGVAIGLDRGLALFIEGVGSEHETRKRGDVVFGHAHIGIKYAFATGHRHMWQPYAKASIGGTFLWFDDDRHFNRHSKKDDSGYIGPSLGFGAGVDRFIGRRTALFAEIGVTVGEFDQIVIDGKKHNLPHDIGINSGRIQFGLRYRL
jgi:hypothetical protein